MRKSGVSLLEVLVALGLFGLCAVAVIGANMLGKHNADSANNTTVATMTANSQLNEFKGSDFSDLAVLDQIQVEQGCHAATPEEQDACNCSGWETSIVAVGPVPGLYRMNITVYSFDGREAKFVTYLTSY